MPVPVWASTRRSLDTYRSEPSPGRVLGRRSRRARILGWLASSTRVTADYAQALSSRGAPYTWRPNGAPQQIASLSKSLASMARNGDADRALTACARGLASLKTSLPTPARPHSDRHRQHLSQLGRTKKATDTLGQAIAVAQEQGRRRGNRSAASSGAECTHSRASSEAASDIAAAEALLRTAPVPAYSPGSDSPPESSPSAMRTGLSPPQPSKRRCAAR